MRSAIKSIIPILMLGGVLWFWYHMSSGSHDYKKYIGKQVVIGKDTLIVTDYDLSNQRYNLSNGAYANSSIIEKGTQDEK